MAMMSQEQRPLRGLSRAYPGSIRLHQSFPRTVVSNALEISSFAPVCLFFHPLPTSRYGHRTRKATLLNQPEATVLRFHNILQKSNGGPERWWWQIFSRHAVFQPFVQPRVFSMEVRLDSKIHHARTVVLCQLQQKRKEQPSSR